MDWHQLIKAIDTLLTENDGRMPEKEVCRILDITPYEVPWGNHVTWAKAFQSNQTFDLIQNRKETSYGNRQADEES